MTDINPIPMRYRPSHKVKVRKIAHDINKSWSDRYHNWFDSCEIDDAFYDLWGHNKCKLTPYLILSQYHCIDWEHIGPEERSDIIKNVLYIMDTPYLRFGNHVFYMYDVDAVEKTASIPEEPRSWLHRWCDKIFGDG